MWNHHVNHNAFFLSHAYVLEDGICSFSTHKHIHMQWKHLESNGHTLWSTHTDALTQCSSNVGLWSTIEHKREDQFLFKGRGPRKHCLEVPQRLLWCRHRGTPQGRAHAPQCLQLCDCCSDDGPPRKHFLRLQRPTQTLKTSVFTEVSKL